MAIDHDQILKCPIDPARRSLLVEFVETYLPLKTREQAEFQQLVESEREYVEVQQMITVYEKQALEKGIQQGIEKGIEQGIEQGLLRGKQEALILLLVKKFGKVSATVERKIRRIDSADRLESLLVAALDVHSIKDLSI